MPALAMTSVQRGAAAIRCEPVDRVPTYIPAINCEVASALLGRKAYGGTGSLHYAESLAWSRGDAAHDEFERQLERDVVELLDALDIDVLRMPWRMTWRPTRRLDEWTFLFGAEDGAHEVWRYNPDSADYSCVQRVTAPEQPPPVKHHGTDAAVRAHAELCRRHSRSFFVVATGGGITAGVSEEAMIQLATEPQRVARGCMDQARRAVEFGRGLAAAGCPLVMLGGGDLAGKTGPMYSPAMFREVVLPAYRHALSRLSAIGVHYVFRSDGNLWPLADMLFTEAACPGFGEADRDAGMTVAALRQRYPRLVIWGNVSSQLLVHGTPALVRDEARRVLDEADGLGIFQGCSNAIVRSTPPDNVLAMFSVR